MELGNKIIKLRKREKLSQEQLADIIGVTRQTISNWELNITKPDINQIKKMKEIFNINIDKLLDDKIKDITDNNSNIKENKINKKSKNIRKIITIIYFIILFILISFIIYCLTKKDFTNKYQTEITCTLEGEKYNLAIEENDNNDLEIIISKYNEEEYFWSVEERYKAGSSVDESLKSLHSAKNVYISQGATCK